MKINKIKRRLYQDFFLTNRLDEYEDLLKRVLSSGYEIHSVISFYRLLKTNKLDAKKKYFINRHDIDTDLKTAKKIFQIEEKLNVKSSYYFRWCTFDKEFIRAINQYGAEASYHFEEIATFCKKNKIYSQQDVLVNLPKIQDIFIKNFKSFEYETGCKLKSVCSHGDFVNRRLNITNNILIDERVRKACKLLVEAYDEILLEQVASYISDTYGPLFYKPEHVYNCIDREDKVIYLLTHPRHWKASIIENLKDDIFRLYEGILYDLR